MAQRKLAAIMFTDIVGYTALMGSDEDKAFDMLKRNHAIHKKLISQFNGTFIKEIGDGTLASFPLASDAVRCAIAIQNECLEKNIPLKIGIHEGEMVFAGTDVLGDSVNIASRLQESAEEGCIAISGSVYSNIKNKTGIKTRFLEEKTFRNVDEPIKVYEVQFKEKSEEVSKEEQIKGLNGKNRLPYYIIGGLLLVIAIILVWYLVPQKQKSTSSADIFIEKSIAVLPFKNDSPDPENEYFCNGMMETILNHLVKVGDLKVMSRTDVEPYRGSSKSRKEIAHELSVANILEGSVYKMGNRFRLSVQLINPESGYHLWSDAYEGEYTEELFALQSDIARDVALALKAVITPEEEQQIEKPPTTNIQAYDYLTKGWEMHHEYWQTLDNNYLDIAKNLATRALSIDPEYIEAHTLKSNIFWMERKADSVLFYADQIIKIDPNQFAGYYSRATAYQQMGKSNLALESYKKALEIEPDNIWINADLSKLYCRAFQDMANGLIHMNKAVQLEEDPTPGLTLVAAEAFLRMGLYELAEDYINKAIDLGERCQGIQRLCECLYAQGRLNESLYYLDSICDISACDKLCHFYKFYVNMALRQYESAEVYYNQISESGTITDNLWSFFDMDSVLLGYMYMELGDEVKSSRIFIDVLKSSENKLRKVDDLTTYEYLMACLDLSYIHAIQDNKEAALDYLKKAVDQGLRASRCDFSQIELYFQDLKDDPGYKAFMKKAEEEKAAVKELFREMKESGEIDL